jgi:Domain of unknown function (DUF4159)
MPSSSAAVNRYPRRTSACSWKSAIADREAMDNRRVDRRTFLKGVVSTASAAGLTMTEASETFASLMSGQKPKQGQQQDGRPRASDFVFARVRYTSGDWDFNPKVAANVLNSIVEYTTIPVYREEVVITLDSKELFAFPFLFMTGHKLVRFSQAERDTLRQYVERGGLLFSDDCNHDVAGLYAQSFEHEMQTVFGAKALAKIPNTHPLYRAFFTFPDGPPQTSHELNGWGDDTVHDYLKAVSTNGRIGVLYSNKDYGCEWDYDWKNKRFQRDDNTRFAINVVSYAMTT